MRLNYILIVVIGLMSCSKKDNIIYVSKDTIRTISVDLSNAKPIWTSELIDSVKYIPLETTPESLLSELKNVYVHKGFVYLLDDNYSLLKFDATGKFICKIGGQGKGPGEYLSLQDFTIWDNKIWALNNGVVYIYNLNGDFIKKIGTIAERSLSGSGIEVTTDGIYIYNIYKDYKSETGQNGYIMFLDHDANIKHGYIKHNPEIDFNLMLSTGNTLNRYGENILFGKLFSDTVYLINSEKIIRKYAYDFGDKSMTMDERIKLQEANINVGTEAMPFTPPEGDILKIRSKVQGVVKSFLFDNSILTCFLYNGQPIFHYKSFTTNEELLFDKVIDNKGYGMNFYKFFASDGKFISYIPGLILHKHLPNGNVELAELQRTRTIDDNPIILVYKLKLE